MHAYLQNVSINTNYAEIRHDSANESEGSFEDESRGSLQPDPEPDIREHADPPVRTWNARTSIYIITLIGVITDWPWEIVQGIQKTIHH